VTEQLTTCEHKCPWFILEKERGDFIPLCMGVRYSKLSLDVERNIFSIQPISIQLRRNDIFVPTNITWHSERISVIFLLNHVYVNVVLSILLQKRKSLLYKYCETLTFPLQGMYPVVLFYKSTFKSFLSQRNNR
jgi:hypothetical protein